MALRVVSNRIKSVVLSSIFLNARNKVEKRLCLLSSVIPQVHCNDSEKPYISGNDSHTVEIIKASFTVYENFVSENEEKSLMSEIDPVFKRRRYEYDHWDGAIHGYKETEKISWNHENLKILKRLRELAFDKDSVHLQHVHVLDLAKDGYIKPHIDSIRFCGNTIAGISLLSSCVMRLVNEKNKKLFVDILLSQRSLYIMNGAARYEFTHEILDEKNSVFNGRNIPRNRRVSVVCRNEPAVEKEI